MKSLELKTLKMNDNFPLIISLNGKVEMCRIARELKQVVQELEALKRRKN